MPHRIINFAEWKEEFRPLPNHLNPNAGEGGILYSAVGDEFTYVVAATNQRPHNTWTLVRRNDQYAVVRGYMTGEHIGYFITEVGVEYGDRVEVVYPQVDVAGLKAVYVRFIVAADEDPDALRIVRGLIDGALATVADLHAERNEEPWVKQYHILYEPEPATSIMMTHEHGRVLSYVDNPV